MSGFARRASVFLMLVTFLPMLYGCPDPFIPIPVSSHDDGTTDTNGMVSFSDIETSTTVTIQAKNENGIPLSEMEFLYYSDGDKYQAIGYDPSGLYEPLILSGDLSQASPTGIGTKDFGITFTIAIFAVAALASYLSVSSAGHFTIDSMFAQDAVMTFCADKQGYTSTAGLVALLAGAKGIMIHAVKYGLLYVVAEQSFGTAITELLATLSFNGYDPNQSYKFEILGSSSGSTVLIRNTGETCSPVVHYLSDSFRNMDSETWAFVNADGPGGHKASVEYGQLFINAIGDWTMGSGIVSYEAFSHPDGTSVTLQMRVAELNSYNGGQQVASFRTGLLSSGNNVPTGEQYLSLYASSDGNLYARTSMNEDVSLGPYSTSTLKPLHITFLPDRTEIRLNYGDIKRLSLTLDRYHIWFGGHIHDAYYDNLAVIGL